MTGEDTIAAIATGFGEAGVGIVRISGSGAIAVGERTFRPRSGPGLGRRQSHLMVYGCVIDQDGSVVDESLGVCMRAPQSFTGEDVVELHCHGGQVALRRVLETALSAGARLAEPGEFTRRAFLNGRIDLSQAEAVIDLIRAKTDRAMEAAVRQLSGGLKEQMRTLRGRLLEVTAHLEADIDFPELNLEVQSLNEAEEGCRWCLERVRALLAGARQGKLLRDGLQVVIAGRPNVGKSSLLNCLVRENRAIVTDVPGTTRDVIQEWISIRGFPVALADTAGIRETGDVVERIGVDRSREMLEKADLVLVVLDALDGVTIEDRKLMGMVPARAARIGVMNKLDLVEYDRAGVLLLEVSEGLGVTRAIGISALTGSGVSDVEEAIALSAELTDLEESAIVNRRQEEALVRVAAHLEAALETCSRGFGPDLISIDVRAAWATLGEITGDTVGEDLLDQIFSRFCIGK